MKNLPEGAGSPISRMPQQQKAGYNQHTTPKINLIEAGLCFFFAKGLDYLYV
jgi:hypothetical protein